MPEIVALNMPVPNKNGPKTLEPGLDASRSSTLPCENLMRERKFDLEVFSVDVHGPRMLLAFDREFRWIKQTTLRDKYGTIDSRP